MMDQSIFERRRLLRLFAVGSVAVPGILLVGCETSGRSRPPQFYGGSTGDEKSGGGGGPGGGGGQAHK